MPAPVEGINFEMFEDCKEKKKPFSFVRHSFEKSFALFFIALQLLKDKDDVSVLHDCVVCNAH